MNNICVITTTTIVDRTVFFSIYFLVNIVTLILTVFVWFCMTCDYRTNCVYEYFNTSPALYCGYFNYVHNWIWLFPVISSIMGIPYLLKRSIKILALIQYLSIHFILNTLFILYIVLLLLLVHSTHLYGMFEHHCRSCPL